ncbi:MAG: hypothetical protein ACFB51_19625 [Anaerolineae bacterium]
MTLTVKVDDRIRLMSALLAMTTWPMQEQDEKPRGIHAHARATRQHLREFEDHPAVLTMQELLESGRTLDSIFSYVTCLQWPGLRARSKDRPDWAPADWSQQMRDLMFSSRLQDFWGEPDEGPWYDAEQQAHHAVDAVDMRPLLSEFFTRVPDEMIQHPNISFPTGQAVAFRWGKRLFAAVPPQIAWGNNPPWPYDEDPAYTQGEAFGAYARTLLRAELKRFPEQVEPASQETLPVPNAFRAKFPEWFDQFAVLFISGLTTIYLEETLGPAESKAYVVMAHKAHGFDVLPAVVDVLSRYRQQHAEGKFGAFGEYLTAFQRALRVTQRLKNL